MERAFGYCAVYLQQVEAQPTKAMVVRQKEQDGVGHLLGGCDSFLFDTSFRDYLVGYRHFAGDRFLQGASLVAV
jgi:hypothetical protein